MGAKSVSKRIVYSDVFYKPDKRDKPFLVRIDMTNTCNQFCKKCFYPDYCRYKIPAHYMSLEEFQIIASKLFEFTYYLQLPFSFEALIHPEFEEIVETINQYSIPNVGIVTNGTTLSGRRAECIVDSRSITAVSVSLDAINASTYENIRGKPDLVKVLENIKYFQKYKIKRGKVLPHLKINVILMRSNLGELPSLIAWCIANNVDEIEVFHVDPITAENDESVVNLPEAYNEIHEKIGRIASNSSQYVFLPPPFSPENFDFKTRQYLPRLCQDIQRSEYDSSYSDRFDPEAPQPYPVDVFCLCPWMTQVIDCWGNVYPCAHRTNAPFGNIIHQDLEGCVNSIKRLRLRRQMIQDKHDEICLSCHSITPSSDPMKRKLTRVLPKNGERRQYSGRSADRGNSHES